MTTYPQYQQQFAGILTAGLNRGTEVRLREAGAGGVASETGTLVTALINAMPYFGDMNMETIHRAALANLMEVNLPNNWIAPHPDVSGPWYAYYHSTYSYKGPYAGYRDAFYHGVGQSSLAGEVLSQVQSASAALNAGWWGDCGIAVLTDAVRQKVSVSLDTGKLSGDLANGNVAFRPGLAASYLAVVTSGFSPTAQVYNEIKSGGQLSEAASLLDLAISDAQFTANINESISMGGDSTNAATWFLYNLWVMLKALGYADVDGAIRRYLQAGLQVPVEVQAGSWWTGGYTSWFSPLTGADVLPEAGGAITSSMPEDEWTMFPSTGGVPSIPVSCNVNESNGYSMSLTQWGALNRYLPQSSGSCFAAGTLVLMADGSARPIETVERGDLVYTNLGPRKVSLKEQPPRGTRTLYRIDDLKLRTTGGHPFRRAGKSGATYCAAEPWTLIDGVPTIANAGVAQLQPGTELLAMQGLQAVTMKVAQLYPQPAVSGDDATQCVYDLLVENWEQEHSVYYVGGPDIFLGVEPESVDPLQTMAVTSGVIAALEMATPPSRQLLGNPHMEIPTLFKDIDFRRLRERARKASRSHHGGKPLPVSSKPGPDCLIQQGDWDPHASSLEYYLTRTFGRAIRSEAANGWRIAPHGDPSGDRLVVGVFDLELINEPLQTDRTPALEICLRSLRVDGRQTPRILKLRSRSAESWNMRLDQNVEVGTIADVTAGSVLDGCIRTAAALFARFRTTIDVDVVYQPRHDVFLFGTDGGVVGRLAIDLRRLTAGQIADEAKAREAWSPRQEVHFATCLGRQLGNQLLAQFDAHASI